MGLTNSGGKKPGGHGNHWGCVTRSMEEVRRILAWAVNEAATPETRESNGREISAYIPESDRLTACAVTVDRTISTGYPVAVDGVVHEVRLHGVEEWANGIEGQIVGSLDDAVMRFFDVRYYRNAGAYRTGDTYPFALAAFVYVLYRAEPRTIADRGGREVVTRNMAAYVPLPEGDIDDFAFYSPVKDVERVRFCGKTFYRLIVPLCRLRDEDGEYRRDIDIVLYAAEYVTGGYVPRVGDDIQGVLWMQGALSPRRGRDR